MKKKLIAIIAVAVAILIIAVVALVLNSGDNEATTNNNKNSVVEVEDNVAELEDIDIEAGLEDSIFEDEDATGTPGDEGGSSLGGSSSTNKDGSNSSNNSNSGNGGNNNSSQNDQSSTDKPSGKMTYEAFHAMSPTKQREYMESFKDIDKFFNWYNKAKKQYEKDHPSIEIDGGPIELQ